MRRNPIDINYELRGEETIEKMLVAVYLIKQYYYSICKIDKKILKSNKIIIFLCISRTMCYNFIRDIF